MMAGGCAVAAAGPSDGVGVLHLSSTALGDVLFTG